MYVLVYTHAMGSLCASQLQCGGYVVTYVMFVVCMQVQVNKLSNINAYMCALTSPHLHGISHIELTGGQIS